MPTEVIVMIKAETLLINLQLGSRPKDPLGLDNSQPDDAIDFSIRERNWKSNPNIQNQ